MYSMKPIIISNQEIKDLPTTMYRMKNIYTSFGNSSPDVSSIKSASVSAHTNTITATTAPIPNMAITQQINKVLKRMGDGEMASLELRQDKVLEQLQELKSKLMSMHSELGICAKPAQPSSAQSQPTSGQKDRGAVPICGKTAPGWVMQQMLHEKHSGFTQQPIDTAHLQDIVINASPNNVPYSLRALKTLWQNRLTVTIKLYTHSSVAQLTPEAQNFADTVHSTDVVDEHGRIPNLNISLIWKEVQQLEMISATANYIPIYGEENILRYLNRIGPNEFKYETLPLSECLEIDAALDLSMQLTKTNDVKGRQQILKELNAKLGKSEYFGGPVLALSDVALSSAIKQLRKDTVPQPMVKWLERVSTIVRY